MAPWFATLMLLAPAALIGVALLAVREPGHRPVRVFDAARRATYGVMVLALLSLFALVDVGPATGALLGVAGIGLSVRLDALSVTLFLLIAFLGLIVVRYARQYLDGDPRQGLFVGGLCLTLGAVLLLVLAGNLVQLLLGWIGTSLALHRLLLFRGERPAARLAARKKFITARLGDACLVLAAALLAIGFGTTDIATILAEARALGADGVPVAALFAPLPLALAALLKSAQFPSHGWLLEVMETPTPVSALLHAGIVNAGGFLVLRFADVMLLWMPSLHLLGIVGGFTALFAGVVMLTQTSVKVSLAWSTVSQMGFMLLQCGLGAFALATLHIVAHSLYKAHAFLASGSVVDAVRGASAVTATETASDGSQADPRRSGATPMSAGLLALGIALALYAGIGNLYGHFSGPSIVVLALGSILVMGLTLWLTRSLQGGERGGAFGGIVVETLGAAGAASIAYFTLQAAANAWLTPTLPPIPAPGAVGTLLIALAIGSFALVTLLQLLSPERLDTLAWRRARVHLANGLYANAWFDRLVGALRRPTSPAAR